MEKLYSGIESQNQEATQSVVQIVFILISKGK
jgi:hypothetical protein